MRHKTPFLTAALSLTFLLSASAQSSFQNLDFENATIVSVPGSPYYPYDVYASNAIPGWTAYISGWPKISVLYNDIFLSAPCVSLQGGPGALEPVLEGTYSVLLQGEFNPGGVPWYTNSVAIGQTGQIPSTAHSLQLFANSGSLQVTFNGILMPCVAIGTGSNYTIYGADISSVAGLTGELRFTALNNVWAELDNIQFSDEPIPEPSTLGLLTSGLLILGWRVARRQ